MVFVFLSNVVKNLEGLFRRWRIHHDFLESSIQSPVLFDKLPVFIQGRGPDALNLPTGQGRLEHIAGIQRTRCTARSYHGMNLVNK